MYPSRGFTREVVAVPASLSELSQRECATYLNGLALVSQIFWGPEPNACDEMLSGQYLQDLTDLNDLLDQEGSGPQREMALYLSKFSDPAQLADALEGEYLPLFISDKGGIAAPLYHSCYESPDGTMMGRPAVMMRERLKRAGLSLGGQSAEPPDHLAVELEYLFLMLEAAFNHDDPRLLAEARQFAGGEMLPWLEALAKRLHERGSTGFYPFASELACSLTRLAAG